MFFFLFEALFFCNYLFIFFLLFLIWNLHTIMIILSTRNVRVQVACVLTKKLVRLFNLRKIEYYLACLSLYSVFILFLF